MHFAIYKIDSDPNSPTSLVGVSNPRYAEREFWLSFITNPSKEGGSPYDIYTTVYLNLQHEVLRELISVVYLELFEK